MKRVIGAMAGAAFLAAAVTWAASRDNADDAPHTVTSSTATTSSTPATSTTLTSTTAVEPPLRADDFALLVPSPQVIAPFFTASAGDFEPRSDQVIPGDSGLFPWAQGVTLGYERIFDFQSVNDDDPMTTHAATAIVRAIVFDTPQNAALSVQQFLDSAPDERQDTWATCGGRRSYALLEDRSKKLWRQSHGFIQVGNLVAWTEVADSSQIGFESAAVNISESFAEAILNRYPVQFPVPQIPAETVSDSLVPNFIPSLETFYALDPITGDAVGAEYGEGFNFTLLEERKLDSGDSDAGWATGLGAGYEYVFTGTREWNGSTSNPRLVLQAFIFNSNDEARASVMAFERQNADSILWEEPLIDEGTKLVAGSRTSQYLREPVAGSSARTVEVISQSGRLITRATVEDSTPLDWAASVDQVARYFLSNISGYYVSLVC